jgi:ABC-type transport system substrate-binding protein
LQRFDAITVPEMMKNRFLSCLCLLVVLLFKLTTVSAEMALPVKTLRYAYPIAETGFDPAQISDLYSRNITGNIFDALYGYDYLARPVKVRPNVAQGMPVISEDFKTYTVKIKPGIYFADDPAFGGKKRELTAYDFAYSFKRIYDPVTKSQIFSDLEEEKLVGMAELRKAAEMPGAKFDYDKQVEGIRALDRYTIQFKSEETRPRFIYVLADAGILGAVAREVVEKYGDKIMEHPVGTGPFRLDQWTRSSKIVLVKNPNFREEFYEADPATDDVVAQAIYRNFKGKRIPLIDRVEISIIEEEQPRWLSFLGGDQDLLDRLPSAFAYQAIPNNRLAPNLVKKHLQMQRTTNPDVTVSYFNMEDPTVGGYTPDKVALRRAIALAYNAEEEIRLPRRNQAIPAQGPIYPTTYGYDPKFKTEMSEFSRAKAMALLDMFGYVDLDHDGWRDMPDGKPLLLEYATTAAASDRALNEIWKKNMDAVGIKMVFKVGKWPEHLKAARAGQLMIWGLGYSASTPDGAGPLGLAYGPAKGEGNLARFENKEFDDLYRKQQLMPDGPERLAIMQQMVKIMVAYMPYKFSTHRVYTDISQPWLIGYLRHPLAHEFWRYIDIDTSKRPN